MYTSVHHLDRSRCWSILSAVRNTRWVNQQVKNCSLFEPFVCLLNHDWTMHCSVLIKFEDDNRTLRRGITMLPRYNKTIVARCDWGPWVLYTLGGKWHPRLRFGCHFPPRVYKTQWIPSQHATIVHVIWLPRWLNTHRSYTVEQHFALGTHIIHGLVIVNISNQYTHIL